MDIEKEDFRNFPFSELFCDFIENSEQATRFYNKPHTYEVLKTSVSDYHFKGDRTATAKMLARFNAPFSPHSLARDNIAAIADENTVTITTGQQVNLFGGPLYTVFKTLSIIYLAKKLTRETGRHVVPVFWLADEDHDYDEIAVTELPDNQGSTTHVALPCEGCARHAAGSLPVDNERFEIFREKVFKLLPETEFQPGLRELLNYCYRPGKSFRDAFARLMAHLFSKYGLVFAGSNFTEAKEKTADDIRKAIVYAEEIQQELIGQSEKISNSYHQQAHIQDSLLFWHDDTQGRVRLTQDNGIWSLGPDNSMTTDELLENLEREPQRFSPNVFFRPLLQDTLIPNAAYIGGPAEIAYYGQMKGVYKFFDQEMPFLTGRMSATLIEPSVQRLLKDLPYSYTEFGQRFEDLEQHYLRNHGNPDLDPRFDHWKKEVEKLTDAMTEEIGITDPGLQKLSQAITREHVKSIDKLRKKAVNIVRQKEEVQISRLRKVKSALFPDNRLQERGIAFIYFMNKYGPDIWDRILEELESDSPTLFNRHYIIHL